MLCLPIGPNRVILGVGDHRYFSFGTAEETFLSFRALARRRMITLSIVFFPILNLIPEESPQPLSPRPSALLDRTLGHLSAGVA
jgi:hypothetical protein